MAKFVTVVGGRRQAQPLQTWEMGGGWGVKGVDLLPICKCAVGITIETVPIQSKQCDIMGRQTCTPCE